MVNDFARGGELAEAPTAYPQWTDYRDKGGLDPLGMQNSSIDLYQRLLPGVSNVTLRVRYYGLYAWLASEYARRSTSTALRDWQQVVRRSEALLALAAVHGEDAGGVAGSRWASRKLAAEGRRFSFAEHADPGGDGSPYLQQSWGAYGAAYGSQLFEIGVLAQAADHAIPVPSPQIGDALATAFSTALGDAGSRFYHCVQRGTVSRTDLHELSPILPSAIGRTGTERRLYEALLFARGALRRPEDLARRDTLLLLLHSASHLGELPRTDQVRWLLYAASAADGRRLLLADERLEHQRRRWRIYQANELLHFSYEMLLKYVLDTLADYPAGVTLASLIGDCVEALVDALDPWPATWNGFRQATKPRRNAATVTDGSERQLSDLGADAASPQARCTSACAVAALKLLVIVEQRVAEESDTVKEQLGTLDQQFFHSLVTETKFLASLYEVDFTTAVARIIEGRIINRHLWVAHRKFRYQGDYTFLVEVDDGRVRLRETSGPVFTNPRLGSALNLLRDIHLIGGNGLTALGRKVIEAQ
ncbi:hypothetical protein RFN25_07375 [Mesorhizobium abyssinicae]|uniref:hypothetical protein n=1 Tax=Mesorhizobium abyssinicae TaxID=1209958 RepID=UPI002A23E0BC|nr:hypothetical protein [Mesorhizobium abyssinicae]MDX8433253.1 hypothetical protein [Mesorhizobium abyssinicae]